MSNTGKELLKTLGLFTLGVAFGYVPMFLCFSEDYDTFSWSGFGGSLIAVIFFLATRYVSLSPGLIERRNLWQLIGLIVLVVLSDVTWQVAIYELPCYLNLFPKEYVEDLNADMQMNLPLYLDFCLLGPIMEEFAFRGVLLGGLLRMRCHPWLAILLSAIVFSAFHISPITFLGITVSGIVYGWLFWRTKSLLPSILGHLINNAIAGVGTFLSEYYADPYEEEYTPSVETLVILIAVAIPLLFFALYRINKLIPKNKISENIY